MSIVRIGMSEDGKYSDGYEAIFGKSGGTAKKPAAKKSTAKKPSAKKPAAKKPTAKKK